MIFRYFFNSGLDILCCLFKSEIPKTSICNLTLTLEKAIIFVCKALITCVISATLAALIQEPEVMTLVQQFEHDWVVLLAFDGFMSVDIKPMCRVSNHASYDQDGRLTLTNLFFTKHSYQKNFKAVL